MKLKQPQIPSLFPVPQKIELTSGSATASTLDLVQERVAPDLVSRPQGYRLTITPEVIELLGHDEQGLFYGRQTLRQLHCTADGRVPCLKIEDWPDLRTRGYMLDISRDRVPKMATIKELIDKLSQLKFNQLQLYTEHTLAYANHEAVWRDASALTFEEFKELEDYCRERFIDLVPCVNTFGHMTRWLTKPEYEDLAECPDGWDTPWGYRNPKPFSLNPSDPASLELSIDLIDQLTSRADSSFLNIGCDETNDLGQGKSKEVCAEQGRSAVYLAYLQKLCGRVTARGKVPMFWGDIVLHHPELIPQLPVDAVLLNWGYAADHPFMDQSRQFQDAGVRFYVCAGTSTWCTITGRGQNAVDNLRGGAEAAVRYGAEGYLVTDWGNHGHWQPYAISWVGLVYGAGVAWGLERNRGTSELPGHISRLMLGETTDLIGRILWDLSNLYLASKAKVSDGTWWFHYLQWPEQGWDDPQKSQITRQDVENVLNKLRRIEAMLTEYEPCDAESQLAKREIGWCIGLTKWVCDCSPHSQGLLDGTVADFEELVSTFRELWLIRCRPGGLEDSVEKLTAAILLQKS